MTYRVMGMRAGRANGRWAVEVHVSVCRKGTACLVCRRVNGKGEAQDVKMRAALGSLLPNQDHHRGGWHTLGLAVVVAVVVVWQGGACVRGWGDLG
jgi:hypothetical protein